VSKRKALKVGDRVELRSGADRGRLGTVTGVQGVAVQVRLDPRPDRTAVTLLLRPSSVRKARA
jgi:ribosomal protein L21E